MRSRSASSPGRTYLLVIVAPPLARRRPGHGRSLGRPPQISQLRRRAGSRILRQFLRPIGSDDLLLHDSGASLVRKPSAAAWDAAGSLIGASARMGPAASRRARAGRSPSGPELDYHSEAGGPPRRRPGGRRPDSSRRTSFGGPS
jgi:hypothetical protein